MRVVAMGLAAGLMTAVIVSRPDAQPAPAPDFARAKVLYDSANTAMADNRFADAVRDYGAAYDITKDPVLFFKIGTANEKAGKCDVALVYYGRYVKEAKPEAKYVALTKERVEACHGDWTKLTETAPGLVGSASETVPGLVGSAGSGSASGGETAPGLVGSAGSDLVTGSASGSAGQQPLTTSHGKDAPWLMVGGALAFVTAGAVLAYSASSSEQDIRDLYVGLDNKTPMYDAKTATRYQELVDEGHRYQYLSWGAFAIATGFGVVATILFVRDHHEHAVQVTPIAQPSGAGASLTLRF
jgi:hypothetical protein